MNTGAQPADDFIGYPVNRVVGTIADPTKANAAVEELLSKGVGSRHIDVLSGEAALHRLDPDGTEHGVLARLHRAAINIAAVNEESRDLKAHVDDVRAGHVLIMVSADTPGRRSAIAETLRRYGAQHVGFFGRWAWQALDDTTVLAHALDRQAGQRFEVALDGHTAELEFRSESEMRIADPPGAPPETMHIRVTEIRSNVFMVSWQQKDKTAVVHVQNRNEGVVYASMTGVDGSLRQIQGTLRRLR